MGRHLDGSPERDGAGATMGASPVTSAIIGTALGIGRQAAQQRFAS